MLDKFKSFISPNEESSLLDKIKNAIITGESNRARKTHPSTIYGYFDAPWNSENNTSHDYFGSV